MSADRLVIVVRADDVSKCPSILQALSESGVLSIELTLTIPDVLEHFELLRKACSPDVKLGIGTVNTVDQAQAAIAIGADYLVTPSVDCEIISVAVRAGMEIIPGAFTPTEIQLARRHGARKVKLFPAALGPAYAKELLGPFPDLQFMPSGGVSISDIGPWMAAGAQAVSLGGAVIGDALRGGSLTALRDRARRAVAETAKEAESR